MIVRLPMYDWPELKQPHAEFWQHLSEQLREDLPELEIPERLQDEGDLVAQWMSDELLLGQTCGLPFAQGLYKHTWLLGSPGYRLEHCRAGEYYSVIVAAESVCAEKVFQEGCNLQLRAAVNAWDSQSGYSALLYSLRKGVLGELLLSGSHRNSVQMIAEGKADIACIDAVSWELAKRYDPAAAQVQVLGVTEPTPCLPMISGQGYYAERLARSVGKALLTLNEELKAALLLERLIPAKAVDYLFLAPRLTGAKQKHGIVSGLSESALV